ncbi:MAG: molybdopterin-dependent oxidoreductase [Candidatus Azobacteroides sp.]|nr:molybdopterin-dependent oxidoreductase [Candidatus Azobacteroides sp.]
MNIGVRFFTVGFLAALLSGGSVFAQRDSLEIRGDVQKPCVRSVDDIKKKFADEIQSVTFTFGRDKKEITYTGIPLISLLNAAKLKTEETPKHHYLTFIVIVEAHDKYRAFFTFAELAAGENKNPVMLVWEENGKPLPDKELPFRLRGTDPDRSIYCIKRITVVDGIKLADRLDK